VRRRVLLGACAALALLAALPALAYWSGPSSSGSGASAAGTMPTGSKPTVTPSGSTLTVSWSQNTIAGLGALGALTGGGYSVTRYADGSSTPITPGASCSGLRSGAGGSLSCAESSVPAGTWRYTITPRLNSWSGVESAQSTAVYVDATPPVTTATLAPALNAAGWVNTNVTVTLSAVDNPGGSGVASISYSATGAQTIPATTYSAPFVLSTEGTTTLHFGAVDIAGNVETTKTQAVGIDRTNPTGSITAPATGSIISGVTTIRSNSADALSGVASVTFETAPAGTGSWTAVGTDTTSPYGYALDTTTLADGAWDFRAVTRDVAGNTFASAAVTGVVDNLIPFGLDIQATNGGTVGRIDAGDTLTYTFSEAMQVDSIVAGWSGAPLAVTVSVKNGGNGTGDRLTVNGANLGTVGLGLRSWVGAPVTLAGTLTLVAPDTVKLTIGACTSGCTRIISGTGLTTFNWAPSSLALDLAGHATNTAILDESGGPKTNF
jgi:hypothetical protein